MSEQENFLKALLGLHDKMVAALDNGDPTELRNLLAIMEQSLAIALNWETTINKIKSKAIIK